MIDHPNSYYAASAKLLPVQPEFEGETSVDVCVIGAGLTGCAAALHLRERGYSVIVLEAARIGWGASGRNGGQINTGLRKGPSELIEKFGLDKAKLLLSMAEEAKGIVKDRIALHKIDCDLKPGVIQAAHKPTDLEWMKEEIECLDEKFGYKHAHLLSAGEIRQEIDSEIYHGGILDQGALHLHPLRFCLGIAKAAMDAGAVFHEHSRVKRIRHRRRPIIQTAKGTIKAKSVVVGCNGYLGRLLPEISGKIFPMANYLVATEPLSEEEAKRLIPRDVAVCDTKFVVDYYRLSSDRRLIFGGGEKYTRHEPRNITKFVRPYMLRVFPQLKDKRIDYSWGGTLAVTQTRLPHFGRIGDIYFAQGYSGQGLAMTCLAGRLIAESVAGMQGRFDFLSRLPNPNFPGGALFRYPSQVIGMMWYALRDRL